MGFDASSSALPPLADQTHSLRSKAYRSLTIFIFRLAGLKKGVRLLKRNLAFKDLFSLFRPVNKKVLSQTNDLNFRLSGHLQTANPLPNLK